MSVRLRAGEDSAVIARTCGTSVQVLHRAYADDIAEAGVDVRSLEEQHARLSAGGASLSLRAICKLSAERGRCARRLFGIAPG